MLILSGQTGFKLGENILIWRDFNTKNKLCIHFLSDNFSLELKSKEETTTNSSNDWLKLTAFVYDGDVLTFLKSGKFFAEISICTVNKGFIVAEEMLAEGIAERCVLQH